MNSLHFSVRQYLMSPVAFVVLRYELKGAKIIKSIQSKYNKIIGSGQL